MCYLHRHVDNNDLRFTAKVKMAEILTILSNTICLLLGPGMYISNQHFLLPFKFSHYLTEF